MKTSGNEEMMRTGKKPPGFAYKILRLFTTVHPGEASTTLLLTANIFLLLLAYYIIKPVREALIIGEWSPEVKSYLYGIMAFLLVFVIKAFSNLASRVQRQVLITLVTLFFISNLVLFYVLNRFGVSSAAMGIIFFIWVGIFSVMVVAQFWAFANDLYTEDAGKRLFPIIAFGAVFGASCGGKITDWLVGPLGLYQMMLVAGGVLGICILLTFIIHKREIKRTDYKAVNVSSQNELRKKEQEKPLEKGGGFRLIFKNRYLLYIALFILLLNFINTNGEYILGKIAKGEANKAFENAFPNSISEGKDNENPEVKEDFKKNWINEFIVKFYGDFYFKVGLISMFIQLFLVSRIFKWFGVRTAIFFLPLIALGGYFFISIGAAVLVVIWAKVIENGTDYSLMNTTRHALFLITSREDKYKAKTTTDTFFHRAGDVLHSLFIFVGMTYLAINIQKVAIFNIFLAVIFILFGIFIAKEHKKLTAKRTECRAG